jgi:hypothetical protein
MPASFRYPEGMPSSRNETLTERAPLLLVFGDLAPRVAALVRARPTLVSRLIVAPREAIHAVAAYLCLAANASKPDTEVAEIVDETDPRHLLRAAIPNCPRRLYRALDRAGDRVHPRRYYERLGTVCTGPFADALLDGDLTEGRIGYYEALARMDPAMVALQSGLRENSYVAEGVDCMLALLRAHGVLRDEDIRLPPRAGTPAIARRLRAALARIEAPDPGFAVPPPFRLIRTTEELRRIGKQFGNCVALPQWGAARFHLDLVNGAGVFLISDAPLVLALLSRVADRAWHLEQCVGPKNPSPPPGVRAALIRDLTAAGLRIVSADPQSSLGRLEQEARRTRPAAGNHEVDLDDDDEDDDMDGIAS